MKTVRIRILATGAALLMSAAGCKENLQFYSSNFRSDIFTQSYVTNDYDFLWVLDNSTSMAPRRQYVRDNISLFLQNLQKRKAMNAQMAVVTTSVFDEHGALKTGPGGIKVMKTTDSNPSGEFAFMINSISSTSYSFWEQGLESAYQAIAHHKSDFSRPGVPLIIITVTDADDYSCSANCDNNENEHNPNARDYPIDRYITLFKQTKATENSTTFFFPITGLDNVRCPVEDAGVRYMLVQKALGNDTVSGSVCDADIAQSYLNIAKTIADRGAVFKLASAASGKGISLYVDGVLVPNTPDNYTYDAIQNAIVFTNDVPKTGATIQVTYQQGS